MVNKRKLLLWWVLANAVGGAIVGALEEGGFQFFATLVLTGPILGVAQWLVLRHYIRHTNWWVIASILGWYLGFPVTLVTREILNPILLEMLLAVSKLWEVFWLNAVNQLVTFTVLGVAQWLVLRQHLQQAWWWILASSVGGFVNGAVSAAVCAAACQTIAMKVNAQMAGAIAYGSGWTGSGLVTGIMLVWLLPNR
ncbi:hypothetical protein [Fischerella thermalis]|uniref:hypothetical protein n=1 Tax=Fischerella thermalis TaxID=372787 RepID=UPI000C80FCA1|nr:hypothetical protein [Fischerella thermalis]MBF1989008.1 hypothetical protein [Fischerella thermalis M58_A2018_009]MBF2060928.1 hypothetical protein [Fischerella thermalis M66_A2018_004]MBF2068684.1 hypothetical protein [Fischerella thermalis M48_A2018_028]PLZ84871.1 hypothetical protein CI593_22425 [Fischerella thermalis CCMEE 5194]